MGIFLSSFLSKTMSNNNKGSVPRFYLSEVVHGWQKTQQAKVGVNNGDSTNPLPTQDLHHTVVTPVYSQVQEEDGQEVVRCSRGARDAKIQAEYHIDQANK